MQNGYFQGAVMGMYLYHLLLLAMKMYIMYYEYDLYPLYSIKLLLPMFVFF